MTKLIILWTATILLTSFGFLPYKSTKNPDKLSASELLVRNQQCTDCGSFSVVKGYFEVPQDLRKYWPNKPFEFNIIGDNTPFDVIDKSQFNFDLITDNEFVLTGKVVGVDSISFKTNIVPIYKINTWAPTKYYPKLWSMTTATLLIYILACLVFLSVSCIVSFKTLRQTK